MGRPRKPTALHTLHGTRPNATNRDRSNEPTPKELFGPPNSVSQDESLLAVWEELLEEIPPGVATIADRGALEHMARLMLRLRAGETTGAEQSLLKSYRTEFGMTPASRSKVSSPKMVSKRSEDQLWDAVQIGPRSVG